MKSYKKAIKIYKKYKKAIKSYKKAIIGVLERN